jgi:hypothetical protein
VLATVLGLSGLKLLDIPGSTAVIVILLGALFLALLVWIGRRTWEIRRSRTERLATG